MRRLLIGGEVDRREVLGEAGGTMSVAEAARLGGKPGRVSEEGSVMGEKGGVFSGDPPHLSHDFSCHFPRGPWKQSSRWESLPSTGRVQTVLLSTLALGGAPRP